MSTTETLGKDYKRVMMMVAMMMMMMMASVIVMTFWEPHEQINGEQNCELKIGKHALS